MDRETIERELTELFKRHRLSYKQNQLLKAREYRELLDVLRGAADYVSFIFVPFVVYFGWRAFNGWLRNEYVYTFIVIAMLITIARQLDQRKKRQERIERLIGMYEEAFDSASRDTANST